MTETAHFQFWTLQSEPQPFLGQGLEEEECTKSQYMNIMFHEIHHRESLSRYLLEHPITPERLSSRTQGYPSMTLYIAFWRSGTDSIESNCPEVPKIKNNINSRTCESTIQNWMRERRERCKQFSYKKGWKKHDKHRYKYTHKRLIL
jgi:hypothetical protein